MEPTREIYWNISGYYFLYVLFAVSAVICGIGIYKRFQLWRIGQKDNRLNDIANRITFTIKQVFFQIRLNRYPFAGLFHALIFGGFFVLFIGTVVVLIQADLGIPIMRGSLYLYFQSLILDIAGIAALLGVLLAAVHRYVLHPDRYQGRAASPIVPIVLFVILFSGFLIEGVRITATEDPWQSWSPVGVLFSGIFSGSSPESQLVSHRFLWWFHLVTVLALFAYLPYSRLLHSIFGPANIFFRSLDPKGVTVQPIDIETADKLGFENLTDFSWKQLFDLEACTECGRCQDNCPVHLAGKSFSPREIILNLREQLRQVQQAGIEAESESAITPIVGQAINEEWLWMCRTCRACMQECPVYIEIIPKLVELRRFQVMESVSFPKSLQDPIECLEARYHPYRGTPSSRSDWYKDMPLTVMDSTTEPLEYLYWVGCTTALNEDIMVIAQSLSELLSAAGVSFGIIGKEEICCGEPARRIGNEYLYETIARQNIETLNGLKFKKIITHCPHCYNIFKHEYPQFGAVYPVVHHSEVLADLIEQGHLSAVNNGGQLVAFHDPCYLGRYNDIYDKPRSVIAGNSPAKRIELMRTRDRSYCCGGGGGGAWLGEEGAPTEERVNVCRAQQVMTTDADILATACPFCKMMMKDGITTANSDATLVVRDIAEILKSNQK
jgi:Fe-S oxidoreductase/nitrate reductase gamma subunit